MTLALPVQVQRAVYQADVTKAVPAPTAVSSGLGDGIGPAGDEQDGESKTCEDGAGDERGRRADVLPEESRHQARSAAPY